MQNADLTLARFAYSPHGAFGQMEVAGTTLFTVEEPWNDNAVGKSCIPEGLYKCVPRMYNKGGYPAIHVTDVPGRSLILIHRGNTIHDVDGCIAPGMELGFYRGLWSVARSTEAHRLLMEHWGGRTFWLRVTNSFPFTQHR